MEREPRGGPSAATTGKKKVPSTQNVKKLTRLILTALFALVLAVVFIRMILPGGNETPVPREAASPPAPAGGAGERTVGGVTPASEPGGGEVTAVRGTGAEPADNPTVRWEIALEFSGPDLLRLEGGVTYTETLGEPPASEVSFSISPGRARLTASEKGATAVDWEGAFDPEKASLFTLDEDGRLYLLLTPEKLQMTRGSVPARLLTKGENTPLVYMQGLVRGDGSVVGTFRSAFVPSFEYTLVPSGTQ
jgi:hypothetical protein